MPTTTNKPDKHLLYQYSVQSPGYDWRLWSLSELKDLLEKAGSRKVDVYWKGTDPSNGGGNGVFRLFRRGDDARS